MNHNRHINERAYLMTEKGIVTGVEQMSEPVLTAYPLVHAYVPPGT
ncbi:hypothetical protein [Leyella lascolaii]|nr:hypothetical protein [Leyella lascolaii]